MTVKGQTDPLPHFLAGLMVRRVPFLAAGPGTGVDPLMPHIYAALAEKERHMIPERTRAALAARKRHGAALSSPANLAEAQALGTARGVANALRFARGVAPLIREIQASGVMSPRRVAIALNARGVRTARGGRWAATRAGAILARIQETSLM